MTINPNDYIIHHDDPVEDVDLETDDVRLKHGRLRYEVNDLLRAGFPYMVNSRLSFRMWTAWAWVRASRRGSSTPG